MAHIFSQPISYRVAKRFNLHRSENVTTTTDTLALEQTADTLVESPFVTKERGLLERTLINTFYIQCRFLNWLIQIPMGVTYFISHSFHNAPRLYHDRTVRDIPEVIGFRSGFLATGQVSLHRGFFICISTEYAVFTHRLRFSHIAFMMESLVY
jgi:hypothetical protein